MTEKELISKIEQLKQIKPAKDWVALSKTNILRSNIKVANPNYKSVFTNLSNIFYQRKFAYALAAFLFIFLGLLGFLKYNTLQNAAIAKNSQANVLAENTLKNSVADFTAKSQSLAQAVQTKSQNVSSAMQEVKDAAKNLTDTIQKNPGLASTVALEVNNNKSILDIIGGSNISGAKDIQVSNSVLEKAVVKPLIAADEKEDLTPEQQKTLDYVESLYNSGNYAGALENILLLNNSLGK